MIVRILGEGQLEVPDTAADELNRLDVALESALERGDEAAFQSALEALLSFARQAGTATQQDDLRPSELILPQQGATMDEVRKLLTDEGLISG
jgi:hypothetical protein